MVLEYEILELPAPVPSAHNDILSDLCSCESGELPGALAIALERAESAHCANLDRLTAIRGTRVQINLNLEHIPRLFVRLSTLSERFLALSESDSQHVQLYQVGVQDLTAKVRVQQRALTGALFTLDIMVRLYGRHIRLQSYTKYFLRDPLTQDRVSQGRKPLMTGLSTTAFSLAEEEWTLATPASIAQARSEGTSRTRLQEYPGALRHYPHATPGVSPSLSIQPRFPGWSVTLCASQCTHCTRRAPGPFHYIWLVSLPSGLCRPRWYTPANKPRLRPHGLVPISYPEEHQHTFHSTHLECDA